MSHSSLLRRDFLRRTSATALAAGVGVIAPPTFVPSSALGRDGATAPSDRIVVGAIGTGGMGLGDLNDLMSNADVQAVAVCDCDKNHAENGRKAVNRKYKNDDCKVYYDFRELVARKDIDVVSVTTPDHWHALASIAAIENGKDVYCEKPLTNSVAEGKALVDAVHRHKRVLQVGTHERSGDNARYACELVRNGRIGKLHTLRINLPCDDGHHKQVRSWTETPKEQPVPAHFDYDMWLGHTPKAPYTEKRCHFFWRFILNYGGGEMTDRGAHVIDIGQLGAGTDNQVPIEYEAKGVRSSGGIYNVFWDYEFTNTYANGLKIIGSTAGPRGVKFEGTDGWIFVHIHGGALEASDKKLLESKIGPSEIQLGRAPNGKNNENMHPRHVRNFLDCVKSRALPLAHVEAGHHTAAICHLNNIAMITGRKVKFNQAECRIEGDEEANKLLTPTMRAPWHL